MPEEEVTRKQARITALAAAQTALRAAGTDFRGVHDLSVAAGDALIAITYLSGGEGRKGKG